MLKSMIQTNDGGFALAGSVYTQEGNQDFWLVKTNEFGFSSEFSLWLPSLILLLTGASLVAASILSILVKRFKNSSSRPL